MTLRVLDPTFDGDQATQATVSRLSTLAGRTVGLLDKASSMWTPCSITSKPSCAHSTASVPSSACINRTPAGRLLMTWRKGSPRVTQSFPRSVIEAAVHRAVCTMP